MSALHEAVRRNDLERVLQLVKLDPGGVNATDSFQQTPLHFAAYKGYIDLAAVLLKFGASVHVVDKNGWTPLHSAANCGHLKICSLLLAAGADPSAQTDAGTSPMHYLVRPALEDTTDLKELLAQLLERGADVDSQNQHGESPLHQACLRGREDTVVFLLKNGADVNLTNLFGETPLHFAARSGNLTVAKLLLEAGADAMKRGDNGTCIDVATNENKHNEEHRQEMLKLLRDSLNDQQSLTLSSRAGSEAHFLLREKSMLIGPTGILPRQRRLRHIEAISARNVRDSSRSNELLNTFYTLHEAQGDRLNPFPFYSSDVILETMNPTWRNIMQSNYKNMIASPSTCFLFFVRVWRADEPPQLLFQNLIDLNHLGYIGTEVKGAFPQNTLVFELNDGLYLREETIAAMRNSGQPALASVTPGEDRRKGSSCTYHDLLKLMKRKRKLEVARQRSIWLREAIEKKIAARIKYLQLCRRRDMLKIHTNELKKEAERQKARNAEAWERLKAERQHILPRARALSRSQIAFLEDKQKLAEDKKVLELDKALLQALLVSLEKRRWKLITQLTDIYVIEVSATDSKNCLKINSIALPNSDFTGCDEEEVATALGCACHVTWLISKYLEVPLRYPITPMCSRSSITDEISGGDNTSVTYPLYAHGADRKDFRFGVFLLNRNMEQLLNSQGWEIITLRHTLPNLHNLIQNGKKNLERLKQTNTLPSPASPPSSSSSASSSSTNLLASSSSVISSSVSSSSIAATPSSSFMLSGTNGSAIYNNYYPASSSSSSSMSHHQTISQTFPRMSFATANKGAASSSSTLHHSGSSNQLLASTAPLSTASNRLSAMFSTPTTATTGGGQRSKSPSPPASPRKSSPRAASPTSSSTSIPTSTFN
ncbi:RING-type E3 ubiquitin transferase [Balamuthia mandrillaris]